MYQTFIGIDISKRDFAVSVHGTKEVFYFNNTKSGFKKCLASLKVDWGKSLVVLETTGGYEAALIEHLEAQNIDLHRANTRQVKHFIRSMGKLAKSDAIDAQGLARYGYERHHELALYKIPSIDAQRLVKLVGRRMELKHLLVQEKNRLKAPNQELVKDSLERIKQAIEQEIILINEQLEAVIQRCDDLKRKRALLVKEVPGIGMITACNPSHSRLYSVDISPDILFTNCRMRVDDPRTGDTNVSAAAEYRHHCPC